ncbi:MAG: HAL/PAL/TAL family ammonia-lyase, partial [Candidatus Dormibacteraceae bacterium]
VNAGTPVYGLTTGFGALDGRPIPHELNRAQQRNLLMSHSAGVGRPMGEDQVRAMMLIRANVLASGVTGVQPATLDALLAMLNQGVTPVVPEVGSVGACGDLAPLAHMALPLIGLGACELGGERLPGATAMARAGIRLPDLRGRDGLALINGTEQTTGIGVLAVVDARRLVLTAEVAAAMSMEALGALDDSFDRGLAALKGQPGGVATAERLGLLTAGSDLVGPPRPGRLRDALSLRCVPQVLGAARDGLDFAAGVLAREINAANDNPIFLEREGRVTSNSGNFHGQFAAHALDLTGSLAASIAVISERRSARLVDEKLSALPAFLVAPATGSEGLHSGLMIAHYTAAAIVAELRTTLVPAAIQSVPTCANSEDHVPMSPISARHAAAAVGMAETVVAIELLLAAQALDLRGGRPGARTAAAQVVIRSAVPHLDADRVVAADIEAVTSMVRSGDLTGIATD